MELTEALKVIKNQYTEKVNTVRELGAKNKMLNKRDELVSCYECENKREKKKNGCVVLICKVNGYRIYKQTKVICRCYKPIK